MPVVQFNEKPGDFLRGLFPLTVETLKIQNRIVIYSLLLMVSMDTVYTGFITVTLAIGLIAVIMGIIMVIVATTNT